MYHSEDDNQTLTLSRRNQWLTGPYAGYDTLAQSVVTGFRKTRSWFGDLNHTVTKPYTVQRTRMWPTSYFAEVDYIHYGIGREEGETFISCNDIAARLATIPEGTVLGEAQNAALKIIAGAKWLAPVALAELDKAGDSVRQLGEVFSQGHSVLRDDRSRWYRRMRQVLSAHGFGRLLPRLWGTAAQAWLAWRYAVQTSILDAADAAKAAAEVMADTPRTSEKAMAHRIGPIEAFTQNVGSGPFSCGHVTTAYGHTHVEYTTWTEAKAWITAVRQYNPPLAQAQAFGLLNLPSMIWEMIPGSFIADWVLDIGSYLEAQNALVGWNVVDSGFSLCKRIAGESSCQFVSSIPWVRSINTMAEPVKFEGSLYTRSHWFSPAPTWTPAFRMNTSRWLDAAALCVGLGRTRFRV